MKRLAAVVLALATAAAAQPVLERRAPAPRPALDGVVDALRTNQLVAISDPHGHAGMQDFLRSVFGDPRFPDLGVDLVLEVGNARYQPLVDRFVNGDAVGEEALADAWLNTTVPNQIYADVEWFRQVRRINANRAPERRLRIVLADPPIDWSAIRTREDHFKWLAQRDSYPAAVIQTEIIGKDRKGLIIYGHGHFQRRNVRSNFDMPGWQAETIVSLIERAGPMRVFTIWRMEEGMAKMFPEAAAWPLPSLVRVSGTTLGALDAGLLMPLPQRFRIVGEKLQPVSKEQFATLPIEQQLDALLWLGADARPPIANSSEPCKRPGFLEERLRRITLTGIPKFEAENIQKLCGA